METGTYFFRPIICIIRPRVSLYIFEKISKFRLFRFTWERQKECENQCPPKRASGGEEGFPPLRPRPFFIVSGMRTHDRSPRSFSRVARLSYHLPVSVIKMGQRLKQRPRGGKLRLLPSHLFCLVCGARRQSYLAL